MGWQRAAARPTSFSAPNGFPAATDNEYMAPLRFATVAVLMGRTLGDVQSISPGLIVSDDRTTGRLAFTTPIYNGAIVRRGPGPEGGLEPTRLFDGRQRPLTLLGADAFAGPAPGLRLMADGRAVADTQPGHDAGRRPLFVSVPGQRRNRTARYSTFKATGIAGEGKRRITVLHLFTRGEVRTRYILRGTGGARLIARMPVWGASSEVELTAGPSVQAAAGGCARAAHWCSRRARRPGRSSPSLSRGFRAAPGSRSSAVAPRHALPLACVSLRSVRLRAGCARSGG